MCPVYVQYPAAAERPPWSARAKLGDAADPGGPWFISRKSSLTTLTANLEHLDFHHRSTASDNPFVTGRPVAIRRGATPTATVAVRVRSHSPGAGSSSTCLFSRCSTISVKSACCRAVRSVLSWRSIFRPCRCATRGGIQVGPSSARSAGAASIRLAGASIDSNATSLRLVFRRPWPGRASRSSWPPMRSCSLLDPDRAAGGAAVRRAAAARLRTRVPFPCRCSPLRVAAGGARQPRLQRLPPRLPLRVR